MFEMFYTLGMFAIIGVFLLANLNQTCGMNPISSTNDLQFKTTIRSWLVVAMAPYLLDFLFLLA